MPYVVIFVILFMLGMVASCVLMGAGGGLTGNARFRAK